MASVSENTIGVGFNDVVTPNASTKRRFRTGTIVKGDDGGTYQYAKANASISASTSTCNITVSSGEYVVAATGGSATSPAVAMSSGDFGWFKL